MSEKPQPTQDDDFDPLAESRSRASAGKQIYEDFMERNADKDLTPGEHTEAYQQMADYLQSRPYKDRNGKLHDPITGGFISESEAGVFYTPSSSESEDGEEVDQYKSMSLSALAALSAESEFHNDRTTMLSVDDEIQQRLIDMDLKDELVEKDGSTRDNSERSMVLEHVMKLRQQYLEKMKKDAESPEDGDNGDKDKEPAGPNPEDEPEKPGETGTPDDDKDNGGGPESNDDGDDKTPEDEPFDPWKKFGEVMEEVKDEQVKKEIGSELSGEDMSKIAEIARNQVEGNMPKDEDEYYSGGEIKPESPENPDDSEPNLEISDTALEALNLSRENYASLSAQRRGETLTRSKEALEAAKADYEAALLQANQELLGLLAESGMTPDQARMIILDSSLEENKKLMQEIAEKRVENSSNKRFSKFYKWFGSQQGFKGRIKKGLATAAITAPLGLAAGAVGLAMLGPIAGAVAGAALARGVARGIALSKINKEAASVNLATTEGREDLQEAERSLISWMQTHPGETPPPSIITGVAEQTTRERLSENRKRTAKLMTIGALVATASAFAANLLFGGGGGGGGVHETPNGNGPLDMPGNTGPGTVPRVPGPIDMPGNTGPGTVPRVPGPIDMPGNTGPGTVPIPKIDFLPPEAIPTGSFRYPWGWASETFGKSNATPMLETLIKRAQDAGENVRWNPNPGGVRYIEVNGASDTKTVVDLLKQFVKPGELKGGPSLPSTL